MEKQATGTKRSADDTTRARRQRTQQGAQTTLVCAVCRLRPQGGGGQRERGPDTLSPRVVAWVGCVCGACLRVFVGFFGLVVFGGLGVFWGCLACFLVF